MVNSKIIMAVQSRTSGRFLLKRINDIWTLPAVITNDPNQAVIFQALQLCQNLMQVQDSDDWLLDYIEMPGHQLFHVWVNGEPLGTEEADWYAMFHFPEELDPMINKVLKNKVFLQKTIQIDN